MLLFNVGLFSLNDYEKIDDHKDNADHTEYSLERGSEPNCQALIGREQEVFKCKGEQYPINGKFETDMPLKLETLVGIIPQPDVEKMLRIEAGDELKPGCYHKIT